MAPNNEFHFYSIKSLTEHTGYRAANLLEMVEALEKVPESSIFYHTHQTFLQHHFLASEFSNDFALWVKDVLQNDALAEKLANIDTNEFSSIEDIRQEIIATVKSFIKRKTAENVPKDKVFHFLSARSFVFPTNQQATNLEEFVSVMKNISINSIFFHYFIAHLRLGRKTNDFTFWIKNTLQNEKLAKQIARLHPQMYTLNEMRSRIIDYCKEYI
ncbi:MAG: DUF5752 family protein [Candidatus Margulisiibacteriota bacterium]